MKKILFLSFINILFFINTGFAENESCEIESGFTLYECRVENICANYESENNVYKTENYEDADSYKTSTDDIQSAEGNIKTASDVFKKVKKIYRENMANIYRCAMINAQKKSLQRIKEDLIPLEKTWELDDGIGRKIEKQINKIDIQATRLNCFDTSNDDIYTKLNILKETSYETCRYRSYLEYMKEYAKIPKNLVDTETNSEEVSYSFQYLQNELFWLQGRIKAEEEHIYDVFPVVFHAYGEYENNLAAHIMLELIYGDYFILRQKLHDTINPINQVGYKIMNAMQE